MAAGEPPEEHGEPRGQRFYRKGELKFLILSLLQERPRHGYDIMRAVGERSGGLHEPSAGAVYPTLNALATSGLVSVSAEPGGRRIFSLTADGDKLLRTESEVVEKIRTRMSDRSGAASSSALREIHRE